jgi:hypothetical protein
MMRAEIQMAVLVLRSSPELTDEELISFSLQKGSDPPPFTHGGKKGRRCSRTVHESIRNAVFNVARS